MHMHIGVYVCTHICINPNEDGPPATPISDGVYDIFSSYVTPIRGTYSPRPSNERCTIGPPRPNADGYAGVFYTYLGWARTHLSSLF